MKLALIHSLRGSAAERTRHLTTGTAIYESVPDYAHYETLVKEVFNPQAEEDLSRSEFIARRQGIREDVGHYYSIKSSLFMEAYGMEGPFTVLFTETLKGLYNQVVKRQLRRAGPTNPEELRATLYRIVAAERVAVLEGYGESQSLDGLSAISTPTEHQRSPQPGSYEEPMEINHMGPQNKNKAPAREKERDKQCFTCGRRGHIARNCRSRGAQKPQDRSKQGAKGETKKCYHCQRPGHVIADCMAKKRGKPKTMPGKIQTVNEASWESLDEEKLLQLLETREASGQIQQIQPGGYPISRHNRDRPALN